MGCSASVQRDGNPQQPPHSFASTSVGEAAIPQDRPITSEVEDSKGKIQAWGAAESNTGVAVEREKQLRKMMSMDFSKQGPELVLNYLMEGHKRFFDGHSLHPHQDPRHLHEIATRQHPVAAILGCSDSRVAPEMLFDQGFGDLFICRVAGNVATPDEIASLEYSVLDLGVKVIMILGHTRCGAVKAALSGQAFPGFIDALLQNIDTALERARSMHQDGETNDEYLTTVVKQNVVYQTERIMRSKVVSSAVAKGELLVVGAYYDLDSCHVELIVQ